MFNSKKKIEFNNEELRIVLYALNDFRNKLLSENKYADAVNEVIPKLKNKMKVDKYDLGIIINGLDQKRKSMLAANENTSVIDELLLRLLKIDGRNPPAAVSLRRNGAG